jgi:hypothetical protein
MTDQNLLAFGCAVTFIAVAGAYVFLRERFEHGMIEGQGAIDHSSVRAAPVDESS